MISVNPAVLTAFPGDVVDLSMATTYPPPLWVISAHERLASDYGLTLDGTNFEAYRGALQLRSANGYVQWTLDAKCLPGASDSLGFLIGVNPSGNSILEVRFNNAQYKIVDNTGVIQTTSYVAAAGLRVKLELYGASLRAYLDDVLIYSKYYGSVSPYPARFLAYQYAAFASSPGGYKIPAPLLVGDWQCTLDYVRWNVPSTLGSYTTVSGDNRTATVTLNGNPGSYTVTGIVGAAGDLDTSLTSTGGDTIYVLNPVLAVNDTVQLGTTPGGTLPGGLTADTTYYVKSYSSGNVQLSLTPGGAAVNITSNGTGAWIARIGEIALESGSAAVVIPAFDVIGIPVTNNVEMAGGTTAFFRTTYDSAQSANNGTYIVRTVVTGGGGSFDAAGIYTAPATAGVYTLRFESGTQRREFTITVPVTLTPAYDYGYPSEVLTMVSNMTGTLTWSVAGGSLNTTTGSTVNWTLPSVVGQKCRISVTNGTITRTRDVEVLAKFPYNPDVSIPVTRKKTVLVSQSENRTRTARVKDVNNVGYEVLELRFTNRYLAELQAAKAFWDTYHPSGRFFYDDLIEGRRIAGWFDSDFGYEQHGIQFFDYAFRLIQA